MAKHGATWFQTHKEPVGWAVVGLGMGRLHARYIDRSPHLRLVALCDASPAALDAAGKEFRAAERYRTITDLLRDERVQGVSLVLPHNQHAGAALRCMKAGRHVVLDKPFCLRVSEGQRLIETARATKRLLSVFHNRRWDADFVTILGLVRQGAIGKVRYLESRIADSGRFPDGVWRADRRAMGGLLYDWPAHLIDQALILIPARPVSVYGVAQRDIPEREGHDVEDRMQALIRFEDGAAALVGWALASPAPMPRFLIEGEAGGIRSDVSIHSVEKPRGGSVGVYSAGASGKVRERRVKLAKVDWSAYYRNIGAALAGREELSVLPEQALRHVAVVEAAYRSARSGRVVPLPEELF
jgi:scyllo-inositol 2-dehydrogenase (NADP+)